MKFWNGISWKPARTFNGVWWNDLTYEKCYVSSYTGANGRIDSIPAGRSFTLLARLGDTPGTYARVGETTVGKTRFLWHGNASIVQLQLVRASGGVDTDNFTQTWARVPGETWATASYDGLAVKATYAGDTRTNLAPISGFDGFSHNSGRIPLLCETSYSETSSPLAVLVPGKLTQAQISQITADFEASRTTKVPPALLATVAPVANLGPSENVTLALPRNSPRTMFFTSSTSGSTARIRNENGAILDNRLGLVNYDTFSRAVYIDRTATQQYLDNPGMSWAMAAWWDGSNAGLYSQRDNLAKQSTASLTPMHWTVATTAGGLRLLAYDQRLPDDRVASVTHWLAWVER